MGNKDELSGENKMSKDRKRCLSLKDNPLINYPSDERKLPKAFRCKSIHQESGMAPKFPEEAKLTIPSTRTPKAIRPTLSKLNHQMIKVTKSSHRILQS